VNAGSDPASPSPTGSQSAGGQAQRPLMASGRGGAAVVLRGRESRPHGEGRQRDKQCRGRQGGRLCHRGRKSRSVTIAVPTRASGS